MKDEIKKKDEENRKMKDDLKKKDEEKEREIKKRDEENKKMKDEIKKKDEEIKILQQQLKETKTTNDDKESYNKLFAFYIFSR
jgi:septal ring factor EnvC (AmiA/AmiB activator)